MPENRARPLLSPAEYARPRPETDFSHSRTAVPESIDVDAALMLSERAATQRPEAPSAVGDGPDLTCDN
jgi:hypothetical protein